MNGLKMKNKICIIGLGYVGLPLATSLANYHQVIGVDISKKRVEDLKRGYDQNKEISKKKILNKNLKFYENKDLKDNKFDIFIITVPTPVNQIKKPNLSSLIDACKLISKFFKKRNLLIVESTVSPGTTENICKKIISNYSKIKNKDIQICFSPERINPGDKKNTLNKINKVISGNSRVAIKKAYTIYKKIVKKVYIADNIKSAEISKIFENAQRDVNISLMNELLKICELYNIDYNEVLRICSTKWNFSYFKPGLVGGHCVPVDPYYLLEDLKKKKFKSHIIKNSRDYNEKFVKFIAEKITAFTRKIKNKKILFCGISFKNNVLDTRNSKYFELYNILKKKNNITLYEKNINNLQSYNIYIFGSYNLKTNNLINKIKKMKNKKIVISLFNDLNLKNINNLKYLRI